MRDRSKKPWVSLAYLATRKVTHLLVGCGRPCGRDNERVEIAKLGKPPETTLDQLNFTCRCGWKGNRGRPDWPRDLPRAGQPL